VAASHAEVEEEEDFPAGQGMQYASVVKVKDGALTPQAVNPYEHVWDTVHTPARESKLVPRE
jgi:hypothetical protein